MADSTVFLKVMGFSATELECLLKTAIQLLYVDGDADVSEWNLINLVPALLEVEAENASEEQKKAWHEKLEFASRAISEQSPTANIEEIKLDRFPRDEEKREIFLVVLFMLAFADSKLTKLEFNFIINNIARPWGFTGDEVVKIIKKYSDTLPMAEEIIKLVTGSLL